MFDLTDSQVNAASSYIEANRAEVEAEYRMVLKQAAENRQYWEECNRKHFARVAKTSPKPGREALRAKLQEQNDRREMEGKRLATESSS